MTISAITKGSVVEVSSDEPGFYGAWYVATLVDEANDSPAKKGRPNKKNRSGKRLGYLVKYDTLFEEENFGQPLTEVVDSSFVRPLPPRILRRNNGDTAKEVEEVEDAAGDDSGDFELYDLIDAYHRDGWWIGVVKKVIIEGEVKKYVVSFENPPEEVEFQKSQLRFHVDWIGGRWLIPPKTTPEQEGGDINATHTPSKETVVTDENNAAVGTPGSAKKMSGSRKSSASINGSVIYRRNRRSLNIVEADSGVKSFQSTADKNITATSQVNGRNGNTKAIVSATETSGSDYIYQDLPPVEHERIITQTIRTENGNSSQKRKRGRLPKSAVKPLGSVEVAHEVTTDTDGDQEQHPPKRSSCLGRHHDKSLIVTGAGGETTTDHQQDWPFIKRSAIWATIDSPGSYLTTQKPHFSPLMKEKEENREGLAIAQMVTFENLVQRVSNLQTSDDVEKIHRYLETALDLETHGFEMGQIQVRLNKLLSLKSEMWQQKDKLEVVEKEIEKWNVEKCWMEKEMDELKVKVQELQDKMVKMVGVKEVKEVERLKMQDKMYRLSKQIDDLNLAFQKLAATPLSL